MRFIVIVLTVFFVGCSNKDKALFNSISYKESKFINLRNGEKIVFNKGKDDEFIVVVNYIPNKKAKLEEFIISTEVEDFDSNATVTLNGKEPISKESLKYSSLSPSLKVMVPKWANIYKLSFKEVKSKKFSLSIEFDGAKKSLTFYKKPRYLLQKPSFKK